MHSHVSSKLEHPAAFAEWAARRSDKLRHDGRPAWQPRPRTENSPRVVALVHVYYTDLLPEIMDHLASVPVPFDVVVTNSSDSTLDIRPELIGSNVRDIRVLDVPNHGRDILPMISVVNAGLLDGYDLVFKVHTKKSAWRAEHETLDGSGEEWRDAFLSELAGSTKAVENILSSFAEDPSIGSITADGNIAGSEHWGGNEQLTSELLRRLELQRSPHLLRFAAGSIYWIRAFLLNGLFALDLSAEDFDEEAGQIDGTTAHAVERAIGILTEEAGFALRDAGSLPAPTNAQAWAHYEPSASRMPEARVYPFYLPQFHAFPENNSWWGTGFTEWSNVTSAKPVFLGHRQPNLPGDLGFYDLHDPRVRPQQYDLARNAGIEGFMYYYYWFAGKRLMDMPVEQLAASDDEHPFCLMWANENWTRRWDGADTNVLIAQDYDQVPAEQFVDDIRHLITDPRYLRINGCPVIAIYKIAQIPEYQSVIEHWRQRAREFGLPGLELVTVDVGAAMQGLAGDPISAGLDGTLEFPPHNRRWVSADRRPLGLAPTFAGNISRYDAVAEEAELALLDGIEQYRYPGVLVNFDNTARRQNQPDLWVGANPFTFRRWLRRAVNALQDREPDQRMVVINAWNEWAEGAVLEPSQRFGHTYLQAVHSAVVCP